MRYFCESIVVLLFFLSLLIFPSFSSASVDLSKDIAALKEEIKTAQGKINKAKAGETLEKITIPVSIKNMQKLLGSLSQKARSDQNLSAKVKNLKSSLNSLEGAKNRNDKPEAQKILNDMSGAIVAFEKETITLPPGPLKKRESPPPGKVGGADTIAKGPGVDLVVSRVDIRPSGSGGWEVIPYIKNMWRGTISTDISVGVIVGFRLPSDTLDELDAWSRISEVLREAVNQIQCDYTVRGIAPNEEKRVTGSLCAFSLYSRGERVPHIHVYVDPRNTISENNERNNWCGLTFNPSATPAIASTGIIHRCTIRGPHEPPPE